MISMLGKYDVEKVNLNKIVWSGKNVWYQIIFCYARD
jgi:hypothetical protein